GQRAFNPDRKPQKEGRAEQEANAGTAEGPPIRAEWTCNDTDPHAQAGPALSILRHHERAEARTRNLPDQARTRGRDRRRCCRPASHYSSLARDDREDMDGGSERGRRHQRERGARSADRVRRALGRTLSGRAGPYRPATYRASGP